MDKSWIELERCDTRYYKGIDKFIEFVRQNSPNVKQLCPCRRCMMHNDRITTDEMHIHLIQNGMMRGYTIWTSHGEVSSVPSLYMQSQEYIRGLREQMSFHNDSRDSSVNPTMEMLYHAFPYQYHMSEDHMNVDIEVDPAAKAAYEKYHKLVVEAQTKIYNGSDQTVLGAILKAMEVKVQNRWSNKSFNDHLRITKELLPHENNYPDSYPSVRKILKNIDLDYKVIHACEYGCALFYKENENLDRCPVCNEPRYIHVEGRKGTPKRVVRYFPLAPRLQRLYMSAHIAKEMRWHGERHVDDNYLRHPADGKAWQDFDKDFPEFGKEVRNVRLGLATDGFNPFGVTGLSHSTWPIVVMPYNLPPSMCMKKEFNILAMLISGPKSPGKCLNVFMRPLIDELDMLWNTGAVTFDRHDGSSFVMKAAVMWTISDFPGLGMLGGLKTKGYKACPICLDEVDAQHLAGRLAYQGHRRWLDKNHPWRKAAEYFNGSEEFRDAPYSFSGDEVYSEILCHQYPTLSLHPKFKPRTTTEKLCWTHKSIFYELPYWKKLRQPHCLDVMHIEKNVFDNIIGTIFGLEGKTKDDLKAREGLKKLGVRKNMWAKITGSSSKKQKVSQASYTVIPDLRSEIFEFMKDYKYPHGYAGSLKNKINVEDKKFYGLKTHDCHVMLQRVLPVVIRPYLPYNVVEPLIALSKWFQKLCARELTKEIVCQMKSDVIMILCKLERIFPPSFFTIMVHLMIHLPDQALLTGPVHFTWMFPIERQLGDYKKYVRNKRYPEGCIAEQYIAHECVTFCNLYMSESNVTSTEVDSRDVAYFNISVVSDLVKPDGELANMELSNKELDVAHWCVMKHCTETKYFRKEHKRLFYQSTYFKNNPTCSDEDRIHNFHPYFLSWMSKLQNEESQCYKPELHFLACRPQSHRFYSRCYVNNVKFVVWEKDVKLKTQNSGIMVEANDTKYYGILENVIELKYAEGMPVVLFKCKWFNTDPSESGSTKVDHGLLSVDTSTSWYEHSPYILAATARQVFYLEDPKAGDSWKVVNEMTHRGTYSANSLAMHTEVDEAYQESTMGDITSSTPIEDYVVDDDDTNSLPRVDASSNFYMEEEVDEDEEFESEEDEEVRGIVNEDHNEGDDEDDDLDIYD